jgi:hypothetical protein
MLKEELKRLGNAFVVNNTRNFSLAFANLKFQFGFVGYIFRLAFVNGATCLPSV